MKHAKFLMCKYKVVFHCDKIRAMIENENIDSSLHGWKISEMLQWKKKNRIRKYRN